MVDIRWIIVRRSRSGEVLGSLEVVIDVGGAAAVLLEQRSVRSVVR